MQAKDLMKGKIIISALFLWVLILSGAFLTDIYAQTAEQNQSDCTRAIPVRVVKKAIFPNTTFKLNRAKRTGTETIAFDNGDKLIITNAGCEYYYLGFRFETSRFSARPTDTKYWYKKAVELIEQTEEGIDAPVQLDDAVRALEKYIQKTGKPKYEEEIDYGGQDIRTFVTFNKTVKLPKGKYALEIAFAVGPL